MTRDQIDELKSQVDQLSGIKTFKMEYKEVKTVTPASTSSSRGRRRTAVRRAREEKIITPAMQAADFAKLFHSSLIDLETLARPTIVNDRRQESALK
jgi:hypothetical protein